MKHQEFYRKYKTTYPPIINRWNIVWAILITALIEPFIMLRRNRQANLTSNFYWHQVEYFLLIALPFVLILFWIYWRESVKRRHGYCWVGKFMIVTKSTSLIGNHLTLTPSNQHKLRVNGVLFKESKPGDWVIIRRDVFGAIEHIRHQKNTLGRLNAQSA